MKISQLILITLLTGCAQLDTIVTKRAEVHDIAVGAAVNCICEVCSDKAIERIFNTDDKFYSKELFCGENFKGTNP